MKTISRKLGLALLLAGFVYGQYSVSRGEEDPPAPPASADKEPAASKPGDLPQLPTPPTSEPTIVPAAVLPNQLPLVKPPSALPPTLPETGASTMSIRDIVVEATQGPTNANPTGRQEPGVSLEWLCPSIVTIHQPVTCTLIVKSLSMNRLHQVVVSSRLPAGATVNGTEPKANIENDLVLWQLGTLEPRQEKRLDLQLMPTARGSLPCHAFVTFTGSASAKLEVREPRLELKMSGPQKMITGDAVAFLLTVSNPGDARAQGVKVQATLSEGLEAAQGKTLDFNLESLGPQESRTVIVQCAAKGVGAGLCKAVATAEPQLQAVASTAIQIVQPQLNIDVVGPSMRYLDRHAVYNIKVSNPGSVPAQHVTLANIVPPGFKVAASSGGGRHDFATSTVVWFLGDISAEHSKEVSLDLVAVNPGEYKNRAMATAARGLKATSEFHTRIEGLPGLLMELVDVEDPIEVGKELSYEIRVTNTGTKTETNLQLTCTMPEKMEYRGAKCGVGVNHQVQGRDIVFAALPKLAPRADVIYRVNVRCLAPGDLRFQVRVKADGLESAVLREESTRVFGDERDSAAVPRPR